LCFYAQQSEKDGESTLSLSNEEKGQLKHLARDAIECVLFGKEQCKIELSEKLKEKAGAFVTLKIKGELRGCIGYTNAIMPLSDVVEKMAIQSAFHDPRFCGLQKDEWNDIDIELSVISPMRKIENIEEIEVGVHGLYVEKKGYSGLLLPQVATEYGHFWSTHVQKQGFQEMPGSRVKSRSMYSLLRYFSRLFTWFTEKTVH
jgi:AmmeMemoRadiSam system protein A